MDSKEFSTRAGRILGIKTATVEIVQVATLTTDHLKQKVLLIAIPNKVQAKRIRDLAYEFFNIRRDQ